MADNNQELEFSLSLDLEPLKQGMSQAEALMAQGVQRMNQMGGSNQPIAQTPLPAPPIPTAPTNQSAVSSAWEELERIKRLSSTSPDVALASLVGMGGGGLRSRAVRGAMADPDSAEEYQQLLLAIKDLTKSIHTTIKESEKQGGGDPATGLLGFIRNNQMLGAVGMTASNLMSGNMLGAGGSAIGGLIGFGFGGPAGAMAGSAIGGMVGSGAGSFLSGADEAREYSKLTADIAARFGDFQQEDPLKVEQINKITGSGYSPQETAQLIDSLRQNHIIDTVNDRASMDLVQSIQELTRATGLNTEAIVAEYSTYTRAGGRSDADGYMSMMIAGAVGSGMRSHLQEYSEMVGSARMNLVARTGQGDLGDGALRTIQGTLANLLGGSSNTAQLLRDNPALARQTLGGFLATGGAKQYSLDSVQLQMAGVERGRTDEAYISPEQLAQNAARRSVHTFNQFLGSGALSVLGMSQDELTEAVRKDPNFLQSKLGDRNPDSRQAAALQDILNVNFQGMYGRNPNAQDLQMLTRLGSNALANNGVLDLNAPAGDGKRLADLITESQKTEGEKAREAQAERHEKVMEFMSKFSGLLTNIDQTSAAIMGGVNDLVSVVKPFGDFFNSKNASTPSQMQQGSTFSLGSAKAPDPDRFKIKLDESFRNDPLFGSNTPFSKPESLRLDIQKGGNQPNIDFSKLFEIPENLPKFDDTPSDGILSQPGFDTFRFAHGDIVSASPTGNGRNGDLSISSTIVVQLNVPSGADSEWIRNAARSGVQSGADEFLSQLEAGRLDPRNKPRINNSKY